MHFAKGGDLRPLAKLLRSKEKLDPRLREYIAEEIEKPAASRFRRIGRSDVYRRKNDQKLLNQIHQAKFNIAAAALGLSDDDSDEAWVDAGISDHLEAVTDIDAIRHLSENHRIEISEGHLNNVRNRNPDGMFNSRSARRRKP